MEPGGLLGREKELVLVDEFVDRARVEPSVLLVEGEAGIGKTTLWHAALERAEERGFVVLACRPVGSEVQLSYAALGDLLGDVLQETPAELPEPQRRALEVALLLDTSTGRPPDHRAIGLAVLGTLRVVARSHPVLVAIDDVQWLDPSTAAVLEFALRRLNQEPVGTLLAVRAEPRRDGPTDLWRAFPEERQQRLPVGPLSVGAIHQLVRSRLGIGLPRPLLLRVHEVAGGNPFYALELARALQASGKELRLEPGGRLPVPDSLQELVRARLAALPRPVHDLLLVVASLADPTVPIVEAATPRGRADSRLQAAVSVGVLEADGDRISFTHPLLASAVYAEASVDRRRRVHRHLAQVIRDSEAQARHLALAASGPDAEVAAALDRAATEATARGAPGAAAELLELAVALTSLGDDCDLRRRKLGAADAHSTAGAIEEATRILQALRDELPPGDDRAEVLVRLAEWSFPPGEAIQLGERALREARSDEILTRAHLFLAELWPVRRLPFGLRHSWLGLKHAERTGDRLLVIEALARLSFCELMAGRITRGLLERAIALQEPSDALPGIADPRWPLAVRLVYQGRSEEVRALSDELVAEASRRGDLWSWALASVLTVHVEWAAGRWQRASAAAASVCEVSEQIGLQHGGAWYVFWKALVDAHLGRVADARPATELGIALARDANSEVHRVMNLSVAGFLEISVGNDAAALPYLRPLLDWTLKTGRALTNLPTPYALEALVGAGELDEAGELIARYRREARRLDSPWCLAIAARCRAQLAAAQGDLVSAIAAVEEALALHEEGDWPFERARALLVLGRTQRRLKQKSAAKRSLDEALAIFDRLPAPLWGERAREEIRRIGLRHVASTELTENERRVAELAASGLTNRQVAGRLFMSPKTVEANLARAYRKLGIHSRAELGARLGEAASGEVQT